MVNEEKISRGLEDLQKATVYWKLRADGAYFLSGYSLLQPVIFENQDAIVKIALNGKKPAGISLLTCWNGNHAVKIFEHRENALLMERAKGKRSLKDMVLTGREDEANDIICDVVKNLHRAGCHETPELVPLAEKFRSLTAAAENHGGIFETCQQTAQGLLSDPREIVALHGDIHYDNIVDAGQRGWLAIDPKGYLGESGFDYANIFCNPDISVAGSAERLSKQSARIAHTAGIERKRLLQWIIAWSGLMAAWMLEDKENPALPKAVAEHALQELNGG